MESDAYKEGASMCSRSAYEGRISYRSGIFKNYEDPVPEYISPELLILIAQNAPSELDLFKRSLKNRGKVPVSTRRSGLEWQEGNGWIKRATELDCKRESGPQVLSSSRKERNHNLKQFTLDARRSCPEVMIWSDYDTEDSRAQKVKNVKRKRQKILDLCKPGSRSRGFSISVSSPRNERKDHHVMGTADEVHSSSKSVDFTSSCVDHKLEQSRPASAPAISASRCASNAKPWRYGMKKKLTSAELKPAENVSCKRKAEEDPKKSSEVKKYMETKFAQLRKERHLEKARAEAALAARKEKQRKLDLECQTLLKSQAADVKTKQKSFSRPPWTSEYVTLAETFRPWSRASTGDLPPPKVPQNQESVPLDLYTSLSTYEAAQQSLYGGCRALTSNLGTKTRSRKSKTREGEKRIHGKNAKSDMYEMAFPSTHPYHALRLDSQTGTRKKTPLASKARWKSKGKSLKRFNPEKIYQLQLPSKYASLCDVCQPNCVDMMIYRRTARTLGTRHGENLYRATRGARMRKRSKSSSHNGYTNILQQDDCYAVSALKKYEREVCTRSTVKRLKPTSAPPAEHVSLPQFNFKPKYSQVRPLKWGHATVESKDLSLQDIAEVMKSRLSPDSSLETVYVTRDSVSPDTINSHKHSSHASSLKQLSMSPEKHLRGGGTMEVLHPQRKDKRSVDTEISKDVTRAIRRQRMHMLTSLAKQLVKRVDAACAEQLLRDTPKAVLGPKGDSHINTSDEPHKQPVELYCLDEPLQVEPKFYYHCTQLDILYHGNLSELEQAGCEVVQLPKATGMSEMIPSINDLFQDPLIVDTGELNIFQGSVISPIDLNVVDKGMSMSDNIPSGCSSYGPSSPSTDSSSPVILPTVAKYNIRRIKRNKHAEEQARKKQKEAWTLPAEEDIHSVINLYTQHWLSKEKKKSGARCEITDIGQDELGANICSRYRSRTQLHEHAPEKHKFKFGAAPTCSELEMSEPCMKSLESNCCTCADSSQLYTQQNESGHRVACIMQESTVDHINVAETLSPTDISMDTTAVEPIEEENSQKRKSAGDPSQRKPGPEGMLVQIGDMRLCQSQTSFHLIVNQRIRLDINRDDHQLKKLPTDLGAVTSSKVETPLVVSSEDCHTQTFTAPVIPMNITYARRLRIRTTPDGASTNDERIVVELNNFARQNPGEVEPSGSSTSETSTENFRVNLIEVQNLDDPDYKPQVHNDVHESTDGSGALSRSNVLQPGAHVTSSNKSIVIPHVNGASVKKPLQKLASERASSRTDNSEADSIASLNSPSEQSKEKLETLAADAPTSIGEKSDINSLNTTEHCEGMLDRLPTNPLLKSICSETNSEKGEDPETKEKRSTNSTIPSTHSRVSTSVSKSGSHHVESVLHGTGTTAFKILSVTDSAEQRLELLSEVKCEVQSDMQQNKQSSREWQLKSRRDQLEAELQKLDAEIRTTRERLQKTHSVFDTKPGKCEHTAASAVTAKMPSPDFGEYNYSSEVGGSLSNELINTRLSTPCSSSRTLPEPPRQRTPALLSKAAASAALWTLDRSPNYSNSFISEDIQMEEEIFSAGTVQIVRGMEQLEKDKGQGNIGERYGNHYESDCRETNIMSEKFEHWEAKSKPIFQRDQPANEVSEEELVNWGTLSARDEGVGEGSEYSTGSKRVDRTSKMEGGEATIPSAFTKKNGISSGLLDDQIASPSCQDLQPLSMEQKNEGSFSTVKTNPTSKAGEDFTYSRKTLSSALLDMDEETLSKDRLLREDRLNRSSYVTSARNRRESLHTITRENESGISISLRQSNTLADKVHDPVNESSTWDMREEGINAQLYVAGVQSSFQLGNSPTQRGAFTSVSKIDMPPTQTSKSLPVRKQWQVDTVEEDLSSSSVDGAKSRVLKPQSPELEEVVEDSPSSSSDGIELKRKTFETAVNKMVTLNGLPKVTAEISEGVKALQSNSSVGRFQGSNSRACVNEAYPPSDFTPQPSELTAPKQEGAFSSKRIGKGTTTFSGAETSTDCDDPQTGQQEGTHLKVREQVASRENTDFLTATRYGLNDEGKEICPPNLEEENSVTISFQDNSFSESGKMRRLWRIDTEVTQNLTENSKAESTQQLLQRENLSLRASEEDNSTLVTNLPNMDVNSDNLDEVPSQIRPGRLRQDYQEHSTMEVKGSSWPQQGASCSMPIAEGMIMDGSFEVMSASSNARTEEMNRSYLPHSGPPLSRSYVHSTDTPPLRGQLRRHGPRTVGAPDQVRVSADIDQSTDSSTEVENSIVTSVVKEQLRPPVTKDLDESSCLETKDAFQCDLQNSEEWNGPWTMGWTTPMVHGMEHREGVVRQCQENDSAGVPPKATVSTVQEKSSETGNGQRNLLEVRIEDESSCTAVSETIIKAGGDATWGGCHPKKICQTFRLVKPSPSISKNKVGYQQLVKIDCDVTESWQKLFPPVLLSNVSKPVEIVERRLTDAIAGEYSKADNLTSAVEQKPHVPHNFAALTNAELSPVLADIEPTMRTEVTKDCIPPRYGRECPGTLITPTMAEEKIDMPSGSPASTQVTSNDLPSSLPSQPLDLFSSLHGKGGRGPSFSSERSEVSEELDNLELDEKLENRIDAGSTPDPVRDEPLLEPRSPHLSADCWNISETPCPLGQEFLSVAVDYLGTKLDAKSPDVYLENQGEYGLTTSSREAEIITRSFRACEMIEVKDSGEEPPGSHVDFGSHSRNISTMNIPPEFNLELNIPTSVGTKKYNFEATEESRGDMKCKSDIATMLSSVDNVEECQEDANAMITALSRNWIRRVENNQPPLSSGIANEFEQSTSSGGCKQSRDTFRDTTNGMDLGHDIVGAADLDIHPAGLVKNDDKNGTARAVSTSRIGEAAEDQKLHNPYCSGYGKAETPYPAEIGLPRPLPFLPVKPSERDHSLMREILNIKPSGSFPRLGDDNCLNLPKNGVRSPRLEGEKAWSEDKGELGEPQNILTPGADAKFHSKEALKVDLKRLESHNEEQVLTPPAVDVKITFRTSEAPTSSLPGEARRLVESFLSSGSELLDRASEISKAFSTSSGVTCPGTLPSPECSDNRMVRMPLQAPNQEENSISIAGLPDKFLSRSNAAKTAEDNQRPEVLSCEPEGAKIPEVFCCSRPDKIITLRSSVRDHTQSANLTVDSKSAVLDKGNTIDHTGNDVSSKFRILSRPEQISLYVTEFGESRVGSGNLHYTESSCHDDKGCLREEKGNVKAAFDDDSREHPQPKVIASCEISAVYREGSCAFGEETTPFTELSTRQEAEIQDSKEQSLYRQPTEETSTATCLDQESICSIAGSGESQDLDGTLEDIKLQTPANRAEKHNMMADTLTDMLFETLLAEGLSDLLCTSRSISRASPTEASQVPTVSNTPKLKIKSKSNKGLIGVLKHFLPVGWRAASLKHKTGSFLQVQGLRPYQLNLASLKSLSVFGIEEHCGPFHTAYPSPDDSQQTSLVQRTATETSIFLLTRKEYVQSYVQQTLEHSSLLGDPNTSTWYDSKIPVVQDIQRKVLDTEHSQEFEALRPGDQLVHKKLLIDLIRESLIRYSATMNLSPSTISFPVHGSNVVQFVTSRIVDHGTSASKQGPDVDKVVGKLLEDEHWEKCYEEARELISNLAQAILCDLIDRFVQEMIQGRSNARVVVDLI